MQNPVEGKITVTGAFKPMTAWPAVVPSAQYYPPRSSNATLQYFKVTWSINCNGNSKACDSTDPCSLLVDCSNDIGAINGWSSAMYPFDQVTLGALLHTWVGYIPGALLHTWVGYVPAYGISACATPHCQETHLFNPTSLSRHRRHLIDCPQYAFGINIFASASVLNLVQPDAKPFQIAVPLLMTFSQSNPAFHFSMVTDPALLKAFKYSGSGAAANYFFPPVYFNGLPSKLGVRVLFQAGGFYGEPSSTSTHPDISLEGLEPGRRTDLRSVLSTLLVSGGAGALAHHVGDVRRMHGEWLAGVCIHPLGE